MASTEQIFNWLATVKSQQPSLTGLHPNADSASQLQSDLASGSRVAIHRLLMWMFAYVSKLQQDIFSRFEVEIVELAKDQMYGTVRWFVARAKAFQLGHVLVLTSNDATYPIDDAAARIVAHAAVVEMANRVFVKVAKQAGSGLAPLDPSELGAVQDYFQALRPPVQVLVLTSPADQVRLSGAVVYNAQYVLPGVQAAINTAVRNYLSTLDFGGAIRVTDLKAAVLSVAGVVDCRLDRVEVRSTGDWQLVPRVAYTFSGHAALDAGHPITATLSWHAGAV